MRAAEGDHRRRPFRVPSIGRALLAAYGFDVVARAADGDEAISAAAPAQPDVLLLDAQLPGRDGFAVAELMAACPGAPLAVPISSRDTVAREPPAADDARQEGSSPRAGSRAGAHEPARLAHPGGGPRADGARARVCLRGGRLRPRRPLAAGCRPHRRLAAHWLRAGRVDPPWHDGPRRIAEAHRLHLVSSAASTTCWSRCTWPARPSAAHVSGRPTRNTFEVAAVVSGYASAVAAAASAGAQPAPTGRLHP
jgi:CheY-like chemotaxis protein